MFEYPKIETLFMRDSHHKIIPTLFRKNEFSQVKYFHFTEKIHGTNIRVMWDPLSPEPIKFCGRTDNASIPAPLVQWLMSNFTKDKLMACFPDKRVVFYGEGYGPHINDGHLYSTTQEFALFDVLIEERFWLSYNNIMEIAYTLEIPIVAAYGFMTLEQAIEMVKNGFKSIWWHDANQIPQAEGLVGKSELYDKYGKRLVVKLKTNDFK